MKSISNSQREIEWLGVEETNSEEILSIIIKIACIPDLLLHNNNGKIVIINERVKL